MTAVTLERATEARGFAAALPSLVCRAAHDLNNHLALILGKAEIALMVDDPERFRSGMTEICDAGQQARVLVADLQRIVIWAAGVDDGDRVPLAEAVDAARRLGERELRQLGLTVRIGDAGGSVTAPQAATIALLAWRVIGLAAEHRAGQDESQETWTVSARNEPSPGVILSTSRPVWDVSERAVIARAVRDGEATDGPTAPVVSELLAFAATVEFDGSETRVFI